MICLGKLWYVRSNIQVRASGTVYGRLLPLAYGKAAGLDI